MTFKKCLGLFVLILISTGMVPGAEISGEKKLYHRITLLFEGPEISEEASSNPFTQYRLNVAFKQGDQVITVPGFYAADGNPAQSGASAGNRWAVHFVPQAKGNWSYTASFRQGDNIAASSEPDAGNSAGFFDGQTGSFEVEDSDKSGKDFREQGFLLYSDKGYRQFSGSKEYFIKAGPGDPENFLGYDGFDNTPEAKHSYNPHQSDWKSGDPVWRNNKGKEIIGLINYLASTGVNTLYFLSWAGGDGKDAYPWIDESNYLRYDCSKLAQWEIVFQHMTANGIHMHMFLFEHEIDMIFGSGALNLERKIYFREMIARFSHHLGLTWNLGEELNRGKNQEGGKDPSTAQIKQWAEFIRDLDPYDHPIAGHPYSINSLYEPLLGYEFFDVAAMQTSSNLTNVHDETLKWVNKSAEAGHRWIVENDEQGGAGTGIEPDDARQNDYRKYVLWGNLMAGGGGVEYYFGSDGRGPSSTLYIEDMRLHDKAFVEAGYTLDFFHSHVPFATMKNANELVETSNWCLANPGEAYLVYLPEGGELKLDLSNDDKSYEAGWFDPRSGGELQSIIKISGGGTVSLNPPNNQNQDWAVLFVHKVTTKVSDLPLLPGSTLQKGHNREVFSVLGKRILNQKQSILR